MKRLCRALAWLLVSAALFAAEDLDSMVKTAVDGLASGLTYHMEVNIGDINLAGTQSPGDLSRVLSFSIAAHVPNTGKFTLVERKRGIGRVGPDKGTIKGEFIPEGSAAKVTLQLENYPNGSGKVIASKTFLISAAELKRLNITILPDNIKNVDEIKDKEEIINPPQPAPPAPQPKPGPVPPAPQPKPPAAFIIEAWPNSDTGTYIEGEIFKVHLRANRDCYVKVYYIDAKGEQILMVPNHINPDNLRLRANTEYIVPEGIAPTIQKPFGWESVWVQASGKPFAISEAEFAPIVYSTSAIRGIRMEVEDSTAAGYAETRFSFTTLPKTHFDTSYSYPKPANMAETVRSMREEARRQGGSFNGNEREGEFNASGTVGSYRVSGNTVTVSLRYTGRQIDVPKTRSIGSAFNFTIEKPRNIGAAVQAVRSGIEGKGGTFSGNEQQGNFRASGIAGQYSVTDRVSVSINEKPVLIPNALIEKEVKSYFSGK